MKNRDSFLMKECKIYLKLVTIIIYLLSRNVNLLQKMSHNY